MGTHENADVEVANPDERTGYEEMGGVGGERVARTVIIPIVGSSSPVCWLLDLPVSIWIPYFDPWFPDQVLSLLSRTFAFF